ncbi:MAG: hypothetical protein JNK33_06835 [Candidatus Doudnabacteria bacterium]|nr:hypothetical protein [Candidatus Doudnabacteria bacterium]
MYGLLPRIVHNGSPERLSTKDLIPFTPGDPSYPIAQDTDAARLTFILDTEIIAGKPGFDTDQTHILRQLTRHPLAQKTNATQGKLMRGYEEALRKRRTNEQDIVTVAVQGLKYTVGVSANLCSDEHEVLGVHLGVLAGLAVVDTYSTFTSNESEQAITIVNCGIEPVIRTTGDRLGLLPFGAKILPNLYQMDA